MDRMVMRVDIHFDDESKTYWADSPDLDGLIVEGDSIELLKDEVDSGAKLLLSLNEEGGPARQPEYVYRQVPASA